MDINGAFLLFDQQLSSSTAGVLLEKEKTGFQVRLLFLKVSIFESVVFLTKSFNFVPCRIVVCRKLSFSVNIQGN